MAQARIRASFGETANAQTEIRNFARPFVLPYLLQVVVVHFVRK